MAIPKPKRPPKGTATLGLMERLAWRRRDMTGAELDAALGRLAAHGATPATCRLARLYAAIKEGRHAPR